MARGHAEPVLAVQQDRQPVGQAEEADLPHAFLVSGLSVIGETGVVALLALADALNVASGINDLQQLARDAEKPIR